MTDGDTEMSAPSRAELMSVIDELKSERAVGGCLLDAARARADQDEAALRDMTADRDAWRCAAQNLQTELWRQMDLLRAESVQHRDQIQHLSSALAALVAIAESHQSDQPAAEVTTPPVRDAAQTEPVKPRATAKRADAMAPDPFRLSLYKASKEKAAAEKAGEEKAAAAGRQEPALAEGERLPPELNRVGIISELAAVAVDSLASLPVADRAAEEMATAEPVPPVLTVLPTPEPEPKPKQRPKKLRMPRLTT
jgi:hypothetical protein